MKKLSFLGALITLFCFFSCSDEVFTNYENTDGIRATIPSYSFENATRVAISNDLQTFKWSTGDQIGVYASDTNVDAFAGYKIKQGGSATGNFENDLFELKSTKSYYAFYPFSSSATVASATVTYTGQKQTANNSASHLGAFNYMCGNVHVGSNGNASVNFQNIGAVMQVRLSIEKAGTYKTLKVTSDNAKFITKGTASMKTGTIKSTATSASVSLTLGSGFALNSGEELVANILVAPVDMSGSNLTLTLVDAAGEERSVVVFGKTMKAGKAYLYEGSLETPYVTFTCAETQTLTMSEAVDGMEYSVGYGEWKTLGTTTAEFGSSKGNLRLRSKNLNGTAHYLGTTSELDMSHIFFGNNAKVACFGDIRTLIDYENYSTVDTSNARFTNLFYYCSQLTSAPELPSTRLAERCYASMFGECSSLISAPDLPSTSLSESCYYSMFGGCTSLTTAPKLPATTLANSCYSSMFWRCTSLTTAPQLPATSLARGCYLGMFSHCSSLIKSPELPAVVLTNYCYYQMFFDCPQLDYIKMMATDISDWSSLYEFAACVSPTGTFVMNKNATWDVSGESGIPSGWTVIKE